MARYYLKIESYSNTLSIASFAFTPRGVLAATAALSISPVAKWHRQYSSLMMGDWVPFPDPGGPASHLKFMITSNVTTRQGHVRVTLCGKIFAFLRSSVFYGLIQDRFQEEKSPKKKKRIRRRKIFCYDKDNHFRVGSRSEANFHKCHTNVP